MPQSRLTINVQTLIHSLHFRKNLCHNCHKLSFHYFLVYCLHFYCKSLSARCFFDLQLDWRVKVNIIIKVFMKKLNCESLRQDCWLEGSAYHVIYISKFMNLTRYYFSRYSILYHKFNSLIIWCCHSTKTQESPPFKWQYCHSMQSMDHISGSSCIK